MPPLKENFYNDIKTAMRNRDKARLGVLRLISGEIKQKEVDTRIILDDEAVLAIMGKMAKQSSDAIKQFEAGKRADLVEKEKFSLSILYEYLPNQLTESEINTIISETIIATAANSMKDMGKVMSQLKPKMHNRADMAVVSALLKQKIAQL